MRKGFTMIELIFVIVILGVLASVAIPRLAATRDDAEVAKAATNLTTAVSDITAYYTAKGNFSGVTSDFTKITNALNKSGQLLVKGKTECVKVTLPTNTTGTGQSTTVNLTLTFQPTADAVCKQLTKLPGVLAMCGESDQSELKNNTCKIQIGGSGGIQF
ncbi:putative type II secretion system protein [Candidatus Campylobacter infans]|uniref:Putative type II secretion system protein n=1 Tax=Candidatus Campylobacter infans TaxID=2561898 RepID=A0A7H9CNW8_9BACT|nr:prepilin-type N-terminal cleavage/methylation domain-containing protein [Candidatus Campylobacter infans]QLI05944.1 putative type II secretion system protein [Candidatus Campylobacter infans]